MTSNTTPPHVPGETTGRRRAPVSAVARREFARRIRLSRRIARSPGALIHAAAQRPSGGHRARITRGNGPGAGKSSILRTLALQAAAASTHEWILGPEAADGPGGQLLTGPSLIGECRGYPHPACPGCGTGAVYYNNTISADCCGMCGWTSDNT